MKQDARKRAEELVAQMTLEEAASQLCYESPAIERLNIPEFNWWNEALHGVARSGTATVFPQAIGLAASFDDGLLRDAAEVISTEGRAKYNETSKRGDRGLYKNLTYWSPNINLFRDPRWGRGQETYGEDPYLTSRMGVAFVRGIQGEGETLRAAACAKHFAVHSGPEEERHYFNAECSPKDMTETYLPAFEALVAEAKVEGVMGAYNRVNGEGACASGFLQEKLREWGFDGYFVSDAWALRDFFQGHGLCQTVEQAAAMALNAGCTCNCGDTYPHLMDAYRQGLVDEKTIRDACVQLMQTRFRLGLFDEKTPYDALGLDDVATAENRAVALRCAEESIVLLKNDGLLPLDAGKLKSVAVIGPNADSIDALRGNYFGTASHNVTFLAGIREALGEGVRLYYSEGADVSRNRVENLARPDDRIAEAVAMAERADVTILCVGLNANIEGEQGDEGNDFVGGDKTSLELPEGQRHLIDAVLATGKPVVVVQAVGSAINAHAERAAAVLQVWYPGETGGTALANVLFGKTAPAGRLPVTFYESTDGLPDFRDYAMAERTYRNFSGRVLYPFGFGLGYGKTALSGLRFDGEKVFVTVSNLGAVDTDEVVEVYVRDLESEYEVKNHRLCAFARVHLAAGESRELCLAPDKNAFTVVDDDGRRIPGSGSWRLWAGFTQPDALSEKLRGQACLTVDFRQN